MLTTVFPFFAWLRGYSARKARADAVAGVTVALALIPQSMAYAQLVGLPAYHGLYGAFLPPLVAALFGSNRQLATGPVAVVSLMTAAALEPLAVAGSQSYLIYCITLALLVGLFQFSLGFLRLGLVVNLLAHPVVNGFANAAALIIGTSQLPRLFGVTVERTGPYYQTMARVFESAAHYTHWPSLVMGLSAFILMIAIKRTMPRAPSVLMVVALFTCISWAIGFERNYEASLGSIKSNEVQGLIQGYNFSVRDLTDLKEAQTVLGAKERTAAQDYGKDSIEVFQIQRLAHAYTMQIQEQSIMARRARALLRKYLFERVEEPGGRTSFYPRGESPENALSAGGVWRLQVGPAPFDNARVSLTGGGLVVGHIPSGLPSIGAPDLDWNLARRLLPYAIIIALLGFVEAISVAKAIATKTGQRLDPNQELIGQGLGNLMGALSQCYPVSGSFSCSAVNLQAGARTGLWSAFTSLTVLGVLLFLTPLLYHMPQTVLAAVIMVAVLGLLNPKGFVHDWKSHWYDGAISVITFVATLAFAPHLDTGIMIGVGLSLLVCFYKSMRPKFTPLALHPDHALHDANHFHLRQCRHIAIIRFEGKLFFANASFLEDQISRSRRSMPELKHVLFVADGVNDLDASGERSLSMSVDRLRSAGLGVSFCGVRWNVKEVMKRTGLMKKIGEGHFYSLPRDALAAVYDKAHEDSIEENCPLLEGLDRGDGTSKAS
ncbi:MAG: STAS domain-containing protein [Deltaproteobacteria bacterium]|nr:STAS domain-containing protein [Deltaproteobacteria bacterium]